MLPSSKTMNGVIWNKMRQTFVPISSVPVYAKMQQERFTQSRALETHNFRLQNLTLTYFQESNFIEFYDDDEKVTGICGDLWTLLSDSLNFTLQPIRSNESSLGTGDDDYVYRHGLLGIISRNETTIVPIIETYGTRLAAVDFTIPLWMNSYRAYIREEGIHDITWMTKAFSWKIWCIILAMHVLMSVCGFLSQIVISRIRNKCKNMTFGDHFFYNFGMLCNQSYIPEILHGRSRILEITLALSYSILYMAFGAVLFIYMSKRVFIPPFDTLESMVSNTKYSVVTLEGSIADLAFQVGAFEPFLRVKEAKRDMAVSTIEEMFKIVCSLEEKYALFQGDDMYKARGEMICHVIPIGETYLDMWIAAGIVKNFKYKRTIDLGILKLMETGLLDALKERWLAQRIHSHHVDTTEAITMDQVYLMIGVMCCGMITALIIFIIEKVVYAYKLKQS